MIAFNLVVAFVFLNLFIGVILEGFELANEELGFGVSEDEFDKFRDCWADYDPDATCYIDVGDFQVFLHTLQKPWGFGNEPVDKNEIGELIGASTSCLPKEVLGPSMFLNMILFLFR